MRCGNAVRAPEAPEAASRDAARTTRTSLDTNPPFREGFGGLRGESAGLLTRGHPLRRLPGLRQWRSAEGFPLTAAGPSPACARFPDPPPIAGRLSLGAWEAGTLRPPAPEAALGPPAPGR